MNSRAASAASFRRVRQELVRLLYGKGAAGSSLAASTSTTNEICPAKRLDYTVYSHSELRTAYLERLQILHPDKLYSQSMDTTASTSTTSSGTKARYSATKQQHAEFVELQEAWDAYERVAKISKTVDSEGATEKDRNFTLFGVGCSFSDNEAERDLRAEITDQACRGWFTAGTIPASAASNATIATSRQQIHDEEESAYRASHNHRHRPLLDEDDDMFVTVEEISGKEEKATTRHNTRRPSLVDQKFRPKSSAG